MIGIFASGNLIISCLCGCHRNLTTAITVLPGSMGIGWLKAG
jgi:hypothetical protein